MNTTKILTIAAAALILAGCAKSTSTDTNQDLRDYFEAWMAANYPDVIPDEHDIYLISETEGQGEPLIDQSYMYVRYNAADIEGNISYTTDEKVAKQLGTYAKGNYYGPIVVATDGLMTGLGYMVVGMNIGGSRKGIIPFWMNTYSVYDTQKEYFKKASSTTSVMYDLTLVDAIDDINKWEIDSLETHLTKVYKAKPDSLSYGYYYYQKTPPESEDEFPRDTTIYINYTGRLLNGQVFDTTIKDTAIVHGIYSTSKTYSPVSVTWGTEESKLEMNQSSLISGFAKALWNMHAFEKGRAYFISSLGYSYSGSGDQIPAYSPLDFEIELVEKPES